MNKLSVIIPHYNSKDRLVILLNSIPNKEWIEIIVVDDNSQEDVFSLEKKFKHVLFFKSNKKVKGAGSARNFGLEKATGDFFLFADADDYFLEGGFDLIQKHLKLNKDIIYFKPTSENLKNKATGKRHEFYSCLIDLYIKNERKEDLFKFDVPWSKLISKKIIRENNVKFDEVIASNDINFSLKVVFYSSDVLCVADKIYCVTESSNSLTKQLSEEVLDSRFDAIARYNDFLQQKDLLDLQRAMFGHILYTSKNFGLYKCLFRYFYCKYKKYPIFNFKNKLKKLF